MALTCDFCGGILSIGKGGAAICENCGMKYSPERVQEKAKEIKETVKSNGQQLIGNYLSLAMTAYNSDNCAEAEAYCSKVIEIDIENYQAWFLKGKAVAWQSSVEESRIGEGILAMAKGITLAPRSEKAKLYDDAKGEIKSVVLALLKQCGKCFISYPSWDYVTRIKSIISSITAAIQTFVEQTEYDLNWEELAKSIAGLIDDIVTQTWNGLILKDYDTSNYDMKPGKFEWERFIKRTDSCIGLIDEAVKICGEDNAINIPRYETLINLQNSVINSCSFAFDYVVMGCTHWRIDWTLTNEAKQLRRNKIVQYQEKIRFIQDKVNQENKMAAKKRYEEYWKTHAEERKKLEEKKNELTNQVLQLNKKVEKLSRNEERIRLQSKISQLKKQKTTVGVFKFKERKAIQAEIDSTEDELSNLNSEISAAVQKVEEQIKSLRSTIDFIEKELTRDR